jgi:hypothetical protein
MYSSSEAKYCTVLEMLFVLDSNSNLINCTESDSKLSNSHFFPVLFDYKGKDDNQTKEINKIKIAALVNIAVCRAMRDKLKCISISDQKYINHICKR